MVRKPIAEPASVSPSLLVLRVNRPEAASRWRFSPRNTLKRPSGDTEGDLGKEVLRTFRPRFRRIPFDLPDFTSERSEAKSRIIQRRLNVFV